MDTNFIFIAACNTTVRDRCYDLREMGAVLIFEWAFFRICILDDNMIILHRCFHDGVGRALISTFLNREAASLA